MSVIVPILLVVIFVYGIYWVSMNSIEGKKRKAMIINPTDETVTEYIPAFKNANSFILRNIRPGENSGSLVVERKLKQIQAWEIVKESPNVSQNIKDELRKAFLQCDIPIKP
ncbi:MAG: hypothetical protein IJE46_00125 [Clostridia bacterium]|nr:hypothetical protein [Clostridia bacterium]